MTPTNVTGKVINFKSKMADYLYKIKTPFFTFFKFKTKNGNNVLFNNAVLYYTAGRGITVELLTF